MPCCVCGDTEQILHSCNYCGKKVCGSHRLPENHDCNDILTRDEWFDPNLNQHHYRHSYPKLGVGETRKTSQRSKQNNRSKRRDTRDTETKIKVPEDAPDVVWRCTGCNIILDSNPSECPICRESMFARKPIESLSDPRAYRSYEDISPNDQTQEDNENTNSTNLSEYVSLLEFSVWDTVILLAVFLLLVVFYIYMSVRVSAV